MEDGVVLALQEVAEGAGLNWPTLGAALKRDGRLHLETY
jgi:benzoyl-CoA 2,3-epoxidase subunit A